MHLDVPTLMTMGSFISACAGLVLLVAWWQNRTIPALAVWAASDIIMGAGILCFALASISQQAIWFLLGGGFVAVAPGLMWKAARALDAKPAPILLVLAGVVIVVGGGAIPFSRNVASLLSEAVSAAYALAGAVTLWSGRRERLPARWPLVALMALHGAVLLVGAVTTLSGGASSGAAPPVLSPFGLIHFESNIFAIGTAVFVLALINERKHAASQAAAKIDGLTGIFNRAAFMESATRAVERCRRDEAPVSVVMFDLDFFKGINDTHGHPVGDGVIRKFCEVAAKTMRPQDLLGRMGGEEFAVAMPGSGAEAAHALAERIRTTFVDQCRFIGDREVAATASGGVSTSATADHSLSAMLEYADIALYRAKAAGRNRVERADQPEAQRRPSNVLRIA